MSLQNLTATEAVQRMRDGDLAPTEYLQALLDQIAKTESKVEAWENIDADAALETAKALEEKRKNRYPTQPLYGLPFGVKDLFHAQGFPTTANFDPWREIVQHEDAGVVQFIREDGGILLGKQVTTQWGGGDSPKTRNPWDLDRTPGGSSSGSGAAVGARQVPIGIGTQATGSVNRPAAYCGVFGLKATFGRVSRYGAVGGAWSQGHPGIIARSVADLALVLNSIAKYDARDPFSAKQHAEDFTAATREPKTPRLGLIMDLIEQSDPEVRAAAEASIQRMKDAGAEIEEVRLPMPMDVLVSTHSVIGVTDRATVQIDQHSRLAEHYTHEARARIECGQLIPAGTYLHALRLRRRFRSQMMDLFGKTYDGLIAPTVNNLPPDRRTTGSPKYQVVGTLFGFPIVTMPTHIGDEGLPHALQIIGRPFEDKLILRNAAWCEQVFDPIGTPPIA
jgi:aspartyl-tRNA(Asn)/glutamyl-tRNA(Gln) amidotransferase subunit A